MPISEEELDLCGVLGLDFVNTVVRTRAGTVDLLEKPERFLHWMERLEAEMSREGRSPDDLPGRRRVALSSLAPVDLPGLRLLTVEASQLRAALVTLFRRVHDVAEDEPGTAAGFIRSPGLDAAATFTIERALGGASATYELVVPRAGRAPGSSLFPQGPDGSDVGPPLRTRFEPRGPLAALTPIALSAVEVAFGVAPARLRECDGEDCVRWFVDISKGGRRRWCSMARCGNRAKAARYRKRHSGGE